MGNVWYHIIKDGRIIGEESTKAEALKYAKETKADLVSKVIDFEPVEVYELDL